MEYSVEQMLAGGRICFCTAVYVDEIAVVFGCSCKHAVIELLFVVDVVDGILHCGKLFHKLTAECAGRPAEWKS